MLRSNKTKEEIFRDAFHLFTNNEIPDDLFNDYLNDKDGEATFNLQCWVINNMKRQISDWATGIGIIEAAELMYESARENGNLSNKLTFNE